MGRIQFQGSIFYSSSFHRAAHYLTSKPCFLFFFPLPCRSHHCESRASDLRHGSHWFLHYDNRRCDFVDSSSGSLKWRDTATTTTRPQSLPDFAVLLTVFAKRKNTHFHNACCDWYPYFKFSFSFLINFGVFACALNGGVKVVRVLYQLAMSNKEVHDRAHCFGDGFCAARFPTPYRMTPQLFPNLSLFLKRLTLRFRSSHWLSVSFLYLWVKFPLFYTTQA